MAKTTTIPAPPEFPASNASYNSIVLKMHDAAKAAPTPETAMQVVDHLADTIKGVNTYAKAVRHYATQCKAAIINDGNAREFKTEAAAKAAITKAGMDPNTANFVKEGKKIVPYFIANKGITEQAVANGFATVDA